MLGNISVQEGSKEICNELNMNSENVLKGIRSVWVKINISL